VVLVYLSFYPVINVSFVTASNSLHFSHKHCPHGFNIIPLQQNLSPIIKLPIPENHTQQYSWHVILAAVKALFTSFAVINSPAAYIIKLIWCKKFIKVTYSSHWSLVLMMFSCHNATFNERFLCIANYYAHCLKPNFTHFFPPQLTLGNAINCSNYSICCFPGFRLLCSKTSYTTSLVQLGNALHLVPSAMF